VCRTKGSAQSKCIWEQNGEENTGAETEKYREERRTLHNAVLHTFYCTPFAMSKLGETGNVFELDFSDSSSSHAIQKFYFHAGTQF
jgi:hypothetical protein